MDYLQFDIYNKDKFTLRSVARKRQFNFIRYNGKNYDEVCDFIHAGSPNTYILPERILRKGYLYTYSGKTFRMFQVRMQDMRCVIASNPYLVTDTGDWVSLSLKYQDVVNYLKENRFHKAFAYEDILSTYMYNPELSSFVVYDRGHIRGVSIADLPDFHDWYIGGDDHIHSFHKDFTVVYQKALHLVDFRLDFNKQVETIERLKYEINKQLYITGHPVMFNVSWENYARRMALSTLCTDEEMFKRLINTLYNVVYEETRGESKTNKQTLGPFSTHPFTYIVGELRNYYDHGNDNYVLPKSRSKYSIDRLFMKYLEHSDRPRNIDDFEEFQYRLLKDFESFLTSIINTIKQSNRVMAPISEDDYGNLYCGKILLNNKYRFLRGCTGVIERYYVNEDEQTNDRYQYRCSHVSRVIIKKKGIINRDDDGNYYFDRYLFKESAAEHVGKRVFIRSIRPFRIDYNNEKFFGEVTEYSIIEENKH